MLDNLTISREARSENAFLALLRGLGASRLLDVGANDGQFTLKMRKSGFAGMIYSVEPQAACRRRMTKSALGDMRWIILPSQGAGAEDSVMSLKVSENGVSSSFFEPHENHLQAERTVRTTREETAYVTQTARLLPPAVTACIDAIKIDTQGYELNVLKGLGSSFGALKLILAELSAVPCYVGAPGLEEVESYIVDVLGFARVALAPAYVHEAKGEIQQYDGIYVRRDLLRLAERILDHGASATVSGTPEPPGSAGDQDRGLSAIALSLTDRVPKRPDSQKRDFGRSWLDSCHASWCSHAPLVISLSEVSPTLPGIKWRRLTRKPPIRDILASLAEAPPGGDGAILLTNGDILIGQHLKDLLPQMDPDVLYYCSRMDVRVNEADPRRLDPVGRYFWGYDAFFLSQGLIDKIHRRKLFPAGFRIGEPWWDYALPIAALLAGHPVKKFFGNPHPVIHLQHELVSTAFLMQNGIAFVSWLRSIKEGQQGPVTGLVSEFLDAYDASKGTEQRRQEVLAASIVSGLP